MITGKQLTDEELQHTAGGVVLNERAKHQVRTGETLSLIAQQAGCSVQTLLDMNPGLSGVKELSPGWVILVPQTQTQL